MVRNYYSIIGVDHHDTFHPLHYHRHHHTRLCTAFTTTAIVPLRHPTRAPSLPLLKLPLPLLAHTRMMTTTPNVVPSKLVNEKVRHIPKEQLPDWMMPERTRILYENHQREDQIDTTTTTKKNIVVYWMQRDVRTTDNWAWLLAVHWATRPTPPSATSTSTTSTTNEVHVVYALPPPPPPPNTTSTTETIPDLIHLPMTERHGKFLLGGLKCVHEELQKHDIPLHVVMTTNTTTNSSSSDDEPSWNVGQSVAELLHSIGCTTLITDFSPLRHHREWKELQCCQAMASSPTSTVTAFYQVDTHNVVPVWMASTYREYGARTIRPKINKQYQAYLQKFPKWYDLLLPKSSTTKNVPPFQRLLYETYMKMDPSVPELSWAVPGTEAALRQVESFFETGLSKFDTLRNDPNHQHVCSNLSPWINHGHVSFQRITMAVKKYNKYANGTAAYLEEGIVRRELSDNYCYYDPYRYDQLTAAAEWAQETLQVHANDTREYIYTRSELEEGQTHDDLWNAAQLQAVRDGKMHGFLRMYWAKKILEWTSSPDVALRTALYLNDKFNLDGRDPNGFVGVGWSIMGIHDMGWKEREVFGKIRFMNYAGCKRKYVSLCCCSLSNALSWYLISRRDCFFVGLIQVQSGSICSTLSRCGGTCETCREETSWSKYSHGIIVRTETTRHEEIEKDKVRMYFLRFVQFRRVDTHYQHTCYV